MAETMIWERSGAERYAEKYWRKWGYTYTVRRKYISKTVYLVGKDGIEMEYIVQGAVTNPKADMRAFERLFEMHKRFLAGH